MKHKFGLKSLANKVQGNSAPEQPKDSSSTPRKPTATRPTASMPIFIRPELPPHLLQELRYACSLLLRETGPSDEDYAVHVNQPDPLELYKRDTREIREIREQASASQTSLQLFPHTKPTKHRDSKHHESRGLQDTTGAANRQSKPHHTTEPTKRRSERRSDPAGKPQPAQTYPPRKDSRFEPVDRSDNSRSHRQTTRKSVARRSEGDASTAAVELPNAHSPLNAYHTIPPRSERSSRTTSRTAARADARRTSGGKSSSTHRSSDVRPSVQQNNSWADSQTQVSGLTEQRQLVEDIGWQSDNPDYAVVPTLHPPPRRPDSRQSVQHSIQEPSRPSSRAGSIFENFRDGLLDYVMPRPSAVTSRVQSRAQSRAESRSHSRSSSRPGSRGSSFTSSSKSWLRSASSGLRRKGSWSSFRSNKDEDEDETRGRKDNRPDLNRSLPPLPGLDQYKEPKLHIAHLMAVSTEPQVLPALETENPPRIHASPPSAQSPPPPLQLSKAPLSPPRSESSARSGSRPRIPFSEDDSPAPNNAPVFSKEARWLDMEVQRRINAQLSPALSNDKTPGRHSPNYFASAAEIAAHQREEAIRQIARRPLPQDRSDSYRSHNSEARSLSALGFRERHDQPRTGSALGLREGEKREKVGERSRLGTSESMGLEDRPREALSSDLADAERRSMNARRGTDGSAAEKKGIRNRLSRLLGSHGNQARAVVAN